METTSGSAIEVSSGCRGKIRRLAGSRYQTLLYTYLHSERRVCRRQYRHHNHAASANHPVQHKGSAPCYELLCPLESSPAARASSRRSPARVKSSARGRHARRSPTRPMCPWCIPFRDAPNRALRPGRHPIAPSMRDECHKALVFGQVGELVWQTYWQARRQLRLTGVPHFARHFAKLPDESPAHALGITEAAFIGHFLDRDAGLFQHVFRGFEPQCLDGFCR